MSNADMNAPLQAVEMLRMLADEEGGAGPNVTRRAAEWIETLSTALAEVWRHFPDHHVNIDWISELSPETQNLIMSMIDEEIADHG